MQEPSKKVKELNNFNIGQQMFNQGKEELLFEYGISENGELLFE